MILYFYRYNYVAIVFKEHYSSKNHHNVVYIHSVFLYIFAVCSTIRYTR